MTTATRTLFVLVVWLSASIFVNPKPHSMTAAVLQPAVNLVKDGTLAVSPNTATDLIRVEGKYYSGFGPGMTMIAVPYYFVLNKVIQNLPDWMPRRQKYSNQALSPPLQITKDTYYLNVFLVWFFMAPLLAFFAFQLCRLIEKQGSKPIDCVALSLFIVLGTLLLPYSVSFSKQAFGTLASCSLLCALLHRGPGSSLNRFLFGCGVGIVFACDYLSAPIGLGLITVFLFQHDFRRIIPVLWGLALVAGGLVFYHYSLLGSPFLTPYHFREWGEASTRLGEIELNFLGETLKVHEVQDGILLGLGVPSFSSIYGLLISPFRGLIFYSPLVLFGLVGWWTQLRSGEVSPAREVFLMILVYILLNISLSNAVYWSGFPNFFGPRYLLYAMVLGCMGIAYLNLEGRRAIVFVVGTVSVFVNILGAMFQDVLWNFIYNDPTLVNPVPVMTQWLIDSGPRLPLFAAYGASNLIEVVVFLTWLALVGILFLISYRNSRTITIL